MKTLQLRNIRCVMFVFLSSWHLVKMSVASSLSHSVHLHFLSGSKVQHICTHTHIHTAHSSHSSSGFLKYIFFFSVLSDCSVFGPVCWQSLENKEAWCCIHWVLLSMFMFASCWCFALTSRLCGHSICCNLFGAFIALEFLENVMLFPCMRYSFVFVFVFFEPQMQHDPGE